MAALSLQQLSGSHELLKANKAVYTIRFLNIKPYLSKNTSSTKIIVFLFVVHFDLNQSVLSILLSLGLLGHTQNVPQIMCKTIFFRRFFGF